MVGEADGGERCALVFAEHPVILHDQDGIVAGAYSAGPLAELVRSAFDFFLQGQQPARRLEFHFERTAVRSFPRAIATATQLSEVLGRDVCDGLLSNWQAVAAYEPAQKIFDATLKADRQAMGSDILAYLLSNGTDFAQAVMQVVPQKATRCEVVLETPTFSGWCLFVRMSLLFDQSRTKFRGGWSEQALQDMAQGIAARKQAVLARDIATAELVSEALRSDPELCVVVFRGSHHGLNLPGQLSSRGVESQIFGDIAGKSPDDRPMDRYVIDGCSGYEELQARAYLIQEMWLVGQNDLTIPAGFYELPSEAWCYWYNTVGTNFPQWGPQQFAAAAKAWFDQALIDVRGAQS